MVYRPCGANNPNAFCMVTSALSYLPICLKYFLKPFCPTTVVYKNGYSQYRRRNDLWLWPVHILGRNSITINLNNRYIVPYNPYLSVKYRAYINVEVCAFIKAVKYINKYIYKGDDRITIQLLDNNDEISKYLHGKYIGPTKAV